MRETTRLDLFDEASCLGCLTLPCQKRRTGDDVSVSTRQRGIGVAALLIFIMGGCAGMAPTSSPADYPFQSMVPPITIHWRLILGSDRVQAEGLIERQPPYIRAAWVQLLGIDATGRPVSFSLPIRVAW